MEVLDLGPHLEVVPDHGPHLEEVPDHGPLVEVEADRGPQVVDMVAAAVAVTSKLLRLFNKMKVMVVDSAVDMGAVMAAVMVVVDLEM